MSNKRRTKQRNDPIASQEARRDEPAKPRSSPRINKKSAATKPKPKGKTKTAVDTKKQPKSKQLKKEVDKNKDFVQEEEVHKRHKKEDIKEIPGRVCYWLLKNFNSASCTLKIGDTGKEIRITSYDVLMCIGLPEGSVKIKVPKNALEHPLRVGDLITPPVCSTHSTPAKQSATEETSKDSLLAFLRNHIEEGKQLLEEYNGDDNAKDKVDEGKGNEVQHEDKGVGEEIQQVGNQQSEVEKEVQNEINELYYELVHVLPTGQGIECPKKKKKVQIQDQRREITDKRPWMPSDKHKAPNKKRDININDKPSSSEMKLYNWLIDVNSEQKE
ncbi:hypothetical protein V2J09_011393 [Rumex salicifolius]